MIMHVCQQACSLLFPLSLCLLYLVNDSWMPRLFSQLFRRFYPKVCGIHDSGSDAGRPQGWAGGAGSSNDRPAEVRNMDASNRQVLSVMDEAAPVFLASTASDSSKKELMIVSWNIQGGFVRSGITRRLVENQELLAGGDQGGNQEIKKWIISFSHQKQKHLPFLTILFPHEIILILQGDGILVISTKGAL